MNLPTNRIILLNETNKNLKASVNQSAETALIIISCIFLILLAFLVLYLFSLVRRTNILVKKIDYLVEDITYKSESLSFTVETINKFSNYLLLFEGFSKKGIKNLSKFAIQNRNYFYSFIDQLRKEVEKKQKSKKNKEGKKENSKKENSKKEK